MNEAQVMNGCVQVGDTIAYATRTGSSTYMNIAKVTAITEKEKSYRYPPTKVPALKVKVTQTTGYTDTPYETTVGVLNRVVKL